MVPKTPRKWRWWSRPQQFGRWPHLATWGLWWRKRMKVKRLQQVQLPSALQMTWMKEKLHRSITSFLCFAPDVGQFVLILNYCTDRPVPLQWDFVVKLIYTRWPVWLCWLTVVQVPMSSRCLVLVHLENTVFWEFKDTQQQQTACFACLLCFIVFTAIFSQTRRVSSELFSVHLLDSAS